MIRIYNLEVYTGVLVFRETTRRGEQKQREPAGSRSVGPSGFGFWVLGQQQPASAIESGCQGQGFPCAYSAGCEDFL